MLQSSPAAAFFPPIVLNQTLCAAINHLLDAEPWARDKLRLHAGKAASIRIAGAKFDFSIRPDGLVDTAAADTERALTVTLPLSALTARTREQDGALKNVEVHGDADLAQTVLFLVGNLRWDAEEDLSRVIGDIAAHRFMSDARSFAAWQRDARERLMQSGSEYLTNEAKVLAPPAAVDEFVSAVSRLAEDAARLDARIARLTGKRGKS